MQRINSILCYLIFVYFLESVYFPAMLKCKSSFLLLMIILLIIPSPVSPLPPSPQCGGAVPLTTFLFLDKFCEDCYNLYKIDEIFSECRADCFRNDFFYFCLNVTLVDQDTQQKAGKYNYLKKINVCFYLYFNS